MATPYAATHRRSDGADHTATFVAGFHTEVVWPAWSGPCSLAGMDEPTTDRPRTRAPRGRRTAAVAVAVVGLHQGVVPLVVRLLLDADQRFTPALWLPAPWWWIACVGIAVVALALLAAIDAAGPRDVAVAATAGLQDADSPPPGADGTHASGGTGGHDAVAGAVFLLGFYNGVAPFIVRGVFGGDSLLLALPLRLPAPWWWIASLGALAASLGLLVVIEQAKQRARDTG